MYFGYQHRQMTYDEAKREFLRNLSDTFLGYVRSNGRIEGYPEHLLNVFITFDLKIRYELDYELDYHDFRKFECLNLSYEGWNEQSWMKVYELFGQTIRFKHRLSPFIRLFFYELVYMGPFGRDIGFFDMSDELLALMGDEMKELNNLFNRYLINGDFDLINEILVASKADSIPAFAVINAANMINQHADDDKKELDDLICELYITALEKIFKKPELTGRDYREIGFICSDVEDSNFSEFQTDHVYSCIGKYWIKKLRKSTIKTRRFPPRYRCKNG